MNRPVWQKVAGRLARILGVHFYDMYLARRDLSPSTESSARCGPCGVRLATGEDLERIVSLLGGVIGEDFGHYRSFGSACYIANREGRIAGYLWVNHCIVELKGMYLAKLPAGQAFTHAAFVFPEFRGQRIYQQLRNAVCDELHKSGLSMVACLVDKANHRSIKILRQEGMTFYGAGILKFPVFKPILFCRALA